MTASLGRRDPLAAWAVGTLAVAAAMHLALGLSRLMRRPLPPGQSLQAGIGAVAEVFLPRPLARFAATEALLLTYAFHWRAKPDIPAGAVPSFYHRGARPMLWVLAGAGLVELVVLHVIALVFWGPKLAWPLFALSEVGLIYVLGLISSLDKLPILIFDDRIEVRTGLLATHVIPRDNIAGIRHPVSPRPGPETVLKANLAAPVTVGIDLVTPLHVRSWKHPAGRAVSSIGIAPDDPAQFLRATAHLVPRRLP